MKHFDFFSFNAIKETVMLIQMVWTLFNLNFAGKKKKINYLLKRKGPFSNIYFEI